MILLLQVLDGGQVLHLEAGDVTGAGVPVPHPVALRVKQALPSEEHEAGLIQLLRIEPAQLLVERRQLGIGANGTSAGECGLAQSKLGLTCGAAAGAADAFLITDFSF